MNDQDKIARVFGDLLKKYRESAGLTQEVLAYKIESHATHISRLENGHKQPTLSTFFKLSKELGVQPEKLIIEIGVVINTSSS